MGYRYLIDSWIAVTVEDIFNGGEIGGVCAYWDDNGFKKCSCDGFDSVKSALEFITKQNCFDFSIDSWMKDDCLVGRFYGDFLVDAENMEVDPKSKIYDDWKNGKAKLWNCRITVRLIAVEIPEQNDEMFENWK